MVASQYGQQFMRMQSVNQNGKQENMKEEEKSLNEPKQENSYILDKSIQKAELNSESTINQIVIDENNEIKDPEGLTSIDKFQQPSSQSSFIDVLPTNLTMMTESVNLQQSSLTIPQIPLYIPEMNQSKIQLIQLISKYP